MAAVVARARPPPPGGEPGPGLGSGDIAAVAAGSLVGAALCAIMGVATGALVRNQVAGVVGALILMFVGSPLLNVADETAAEFTPFGAAVGAGRRPHRGTRFPGAAPDWCWRPGRCRSCSRRSLVERRRDLA